jgi:hypothetical protein
MSGTEANRINNCENRLHLSQNVLFVAVGMRELGDNAMEIEESIICSSELSQIASVSRIY